MALRTSWDVLREAVNKRTVELLNLKENVYFGFLKLKSFALEEFICGRTRVIDA